MRKKIGLFGLFFLSFGLFTGMAQASGELPFQAAPLSPTFLAYQESLKQRDAPPSRGANAAERPTGYIPSPVDLSHLQNADYSAYIAGRRRSAYPEKYDLRNLGGVTSVKNQNPYGTCWSFSALGSMESVYMKRTGVELDLSEMHLSYFAFRDPVGFTPHNSDILQSGGFNTIAVAVLARGTGAVLEMDAPYSNPAPAGLSSNYSNRLHLQDAIYLNLPPASKLFDERFNPTNDIRKELIMSYGGISVSYYATGIATAYNSVTHAWCNLGIPPTASDHAVLIVGWDDAFPRENFNAHMRPANNGAWLVKNSWGADVGEGGYFWLSYEDSSLVEGAVFIPEETADYDNIYGFDDLGWCNSLGVRGGTVDTAWMANIFRTNGSEVLKAVSFYTTDVNATYDISVYTGLRNVGAPISGTRVSFQTGQQALAGYHTVNLSTPVSLAGGTAFAVVIRMTTPSLGYPIAAEYPLEGYSDNARIERGVSFISLDGASWFDLADYPANACIKAFTANSSTPIPPTPIPGGNAGSGGGGGCNVTPGASFMVVLLLVLLRKEDRGAESWRS